MKTLTNHLAAGGPKRILALDGGGIRGIITLGLLEKLETIVGSPLSDYFDLIGGTSTGSIIAAGLALGWPVEALKDLYNELGPGVFKRKFGKVGIFRAKFSAKPLRTALEKHFGGLRLGSQEFKTGLAIMIKRLDTNSPWSLFNNSGSSYFGERAGRSTLPNEGYLITDIIRASTAAPHYFEPERIHISPDVTGVFVDGGVSPHNNPALQLLLLATLHGYKLRWEKGADKLLIVSLGTGLWNVKMETPKLLRQTATQHAIVSLLSLMDDAGELNELLLQTMSHSPTARQIDREIGDLSQDQLFDKPLISYLRYNAPLELDWLSEHLPQENFNRKKVEKLRQMDLPDQLELLHKIGQAASAAINPEHFPAVFRP